MNDLLENPIWHALSTDHLHLAEGDHHARRYPPEIGPLSGIPAQSAESYASLAKLAAEHPIVLFCIDPIRPPQGWTTLRTGKLVQMVRTLKPGAPSNPAGAGAGAGAPGLSHLETGDNAGAGAPGLSPLETGDNAGAGAPGLSHLETGDNAPQDQTLRQLTPNDAPAMVALAELTEPGPFRLRTIDLGNFHGIFHGNQLVAMAGKRMHLPGFIEVSGVCTHPEARGRGYARTLTQIVIDEIEHAGRTPFLHAWQDNSAVRLYEQLGFTLSLQFHLAVLKYTF